MNLIRFLCFAIRKKTEPIEFDMQIEIERFLAWIYLSFRSMKRVLVNNSCIIISSDCLFSLIVVVSQSFDFIHELADDAGAEDIGKDTIWKGQREAHVWKTW